MMMRGGKLNFSFLVQSYHTYITYIWDVSNPHAFIYIKISLFLFYTHHDITEIVWLSIRWCSLLLLWERPQMHILLSTTNEKRNWIQLKEGKLLRFSLTISRCIFIPVDVFMVMMMLVSEWKLIIFLTFFHHSSCVNIANEWDVNSYSNLPLLSPRHIIKGWRFSFLVF